jgi:hypothetical protein
MNSGLRLLLLCAAAAALVTLDIGPAASAPMTRVEARASPVEEVAEFCLPGWRLNFHSRCVPKRRRWWFR